MKRIIIYHGSKNIIEKPIFGFGNIHNDFGLGFYCTTDHELAKEWSVSENQDGYANRYVLDLSGLKVLDLTKCDNELEWITILISNRIFEIKNAISEAGYNYLINNYLINYEDYDVIIGYRADDSYFSYARGFLANAISLSLLNRALKIGDLGIQIVLKTKKAFEQLNYLGHENASRIKYLEIREKRNKDARKKYNELIKENNYDLNGIYLTDIMRGNKK